LGIFLISNSQTSTNWSLMNVLTQIGLGYTLLFLLWGRRPLVQFAAAISILAGTWLLYVSYPATSADLPAATESVGVSAEWAEKHHAGIDPAWHKNANVGHAIDLWLLNKLPRSEPFEFSKGGYQTINFLPSLATMLFGLMAGELLRCGASPRKKLFVLVAAGLAGLAIGQALHTSGVCPLVKRLWTPSWALFSSGWCSLILAGLYLVVDVFKLRWWTFPLVVVGMNSIAIYVMSMLLKPWAARTLRTHLGEDVFELKIPLLGLTEPLISSAYEPAVQATLVGLMFWLACWWMYRQKFFVRI
jgi:predicted acyltransferase